MPVHFDDVFSGFNSEADHIERIPLAIFYQNRYEGVSKEQIAEIFANTDTHLSLFALDRYLHELVEREYILETPNGGYRLKRGGRGQIEKQLDDLDPAAETEQLVDVDDLEREHWRELGEEINKCYQHGLFSGAAVLYRTLIEDILFHVLKDVPEEDIVPYEEHQDGSDINREVDTLSEMISKFDENQDVFLDFGRQIQSTIDALEEMRDLGNDGAHNTRYNPTRHEVEENREDAKAAVSTLIDILNAIESEEGGNDDQIHADLLGDLVN